LFGDKRALFTEVVARDVLSRITEFKTEAAVTHTGDNYRDQTQVGRLENRPRQIKVLIDYMLASWQHHDVIDASRVGMFGLIDAHVAVAP
jgi:hypothetical protein